MEDNLHESSELQLNSTQRKHHVDNVQFMVNFSRDVDSVYKSIPCNPFELGSLWLLKNSNLFQTSVLENLKKILPTGEELVTSLFQCQITDAESTNQ